MENSKKYILRETTFEVYKRCRLENTYSREYNKENIGLINLDMNNYEEMKQNTNNLNSRISESNN